MGHQSHHSNYYDGCPIWRLAPVSPGVVQGTPAPGEMPGDGLIVWAEMDTLGTRRLLWGSLGCCEFSGRVSGLRFKVMARPSMLFPWRRLPLVDLGVECAEGGVSSSSSSPSPSCSSSSLCLSLAPSFTTGIFAMSRYSGPCS